WEVPEDPNESSRFQPPYRMFTDEDSDPATPSTWAMTSVFVPRDKGNLAAFVSVNSDATSDEFGRMQVLEVTEANASGPGQIANEMRQDEQVGAALTRLNVDAATPPIFGNLLSMPVDDGLISIQPVYAVRAGTSGFPILQYVLVSYDDKVGIGTNLSEALENALTQDGDVDPVDQPDTEPTDPPDDPNQPPDNNNPDQPLSIDEQISQALGRAETAFDEAEQARESGNFELYLEKIEEGRRHTQRAISLYDSKNTGGPGGS
ncbi:MAG TPA: UPF0182 family protein, partial [Nocardioides sp.]|nr:UPF0182 family protein [Nocardioides sp.]